MAHKRAIKTEAIEKALQSDYLATSYAWARLAKVSPSHAYKTLEKLVSQGKCKKFKHNESGKNVYGLSCQKGLWDDRL